MDKKLTGNINLEYLEDDEIDSELRARDFIKTDPKYKWKSKEGQIYIKSKKGKCNYKDYETL